MNNFNGQQWLSKVVPQPNIDIYVDSLAKLPHIDSDQEKIATKEALVLSNLKFVISIAHKYKDYLDLDDLIQEGNIGLMIAAERFDSSFQAKFITYAVHYVRKYMRMAIERNFLIRRGNRRLSVCSYHAPMNFDGNEESNTLEKVLAVETDPMSQPDLRLINKQRHEYVVDVIHQHLKDIEAQVIVHRFGLDGDEPKTLDKISKIIGYTIPGVLAIEKRAKAKLKDILDFDSI